MHCPENHVRPSHLPVGLGANLILGAQSSILFPAWGKAITSSEVVVASVAVSSTAENIMVSSLHLPCFCSCFTLVRRLSELCGVRRRRPTVGDAEDDPSVVREEKAARDEHAAVCPVQGTASSHCEQRHCDRWDSHRCKRCDDSGPLLGIGKMACSTT